MSRQPELSLLYAFQRISDGAIKVGRSRSLSSRADLIGKSSGMRCIGVEAVRHSLAGRAESLAHSRLVRWHIEGEWFACTVVAARMALRYGVRESLVGTPVPERWKRIRYAKVRAASRKRRAFDTVSASA